MKNVEREELEYSIRTIKEWTADRLPDFIFNVFFDLEELDQSKNREFWGKLRQAIQENKEFDWRPFQDFMRSFAKREKRGYWWWKLIIRKTSNL